MSTLPVSAPHPAGPLKVALLSLPERTEAVLEFFFSNDGGSHFLAGDEVAADAAVVDLDHAESCAHWAVFHARTGRPAIALSVTPQTLAHTVWVRKPVTPAAMVEAAARVLHLPAEPAPSLPSVEATIEPAPPRPASNVVAWPRTVPPEVVAAAAPPTMEPVPAPQETSVPLAPERASAAATAEAPVEAAADPFDWASAAPRAPWWRRLLQWCFGGTPASPPATTARTAIPAPRPAAVPVEAPGAVLAEPEAAPARTEEAQAQDATPAEPTAAAPGVRTDAEVETPAALAIARAPEASPETVPTHHPTGHAGAQDDAQAAVDADEDAPDAASAGGGPRPMPTEEAENEARFCGLRDDQPLAAFATDRSLVYRPAHHLVGALGEAVRVGRKWQVPTQFDIETLRVVVDVRRNLLHVEPSHAALVALQTQELPRRVKTRTLSHAETQEWEARRATQGDTLKLDQHLWQCALETAAGRWPDDLAPQTVLYLKHWPNLTRLPRTPHAMRIAAFWATQGASMDDTARTLRIAQRHVMAFANAARALDLITEDGSHIRRAQRKGGRQRNALTRLLGWLNR